MAGFIPELILESWEMFLTHATRVGFGMPTLPGHVFRGQANAEWPLEPKLLRIAKGASDRPAVLALEERLERDFFAQAHLYPGYVEMGAGAGREWMDRLAFMQHYGAPTRLLDWTVSPMAAAYFACRDQPQSDGAVFVAYPAVINPKFPASNPDALLNAWMEGSDPDATLVGFFTASKRFSRQVSQQGHFSLSPDVLASHEAGLIRCIPPGTGGKGPTLVAAKWRIPAVQKPAFLGVLRQLNVTGHTLFPDLDGLGQSVTEAAIIERTRIR